MTTLIDQALRMWGFGGARCSLAAERENRVYRVETGRRTVALRLHRQGYRTDEELASELDWMAALAAGGLAVPSPIPSKSGAHFATIDQTQVDVLDWRAGTPLSDCLNGFSNAKRVTVFHKLGQNMAMLHKVSDAWSPPTDFTRVSWDSDGLVGDTPLWDQFWENPALTEDEKALFLRVRDNARIYLPNSGPKFDFGLIHADLVPNNVLYHQERLNLIDFDDGGWGFRLFDVATALLKHIEAPDYDALQTALIAGYRQIRPLDLKGLDMMMALRALTYVGWNINRMTERAGQDRNSRFIRTAVHFCRKLLA